MGPSHSFPPLWFLIYPTTTRDGKCCCCSIANIAPFPLFYETRIKHPFNFAPYWTLGENLSEKRRRNKDISDLGQNIYIFVSQHIMHSFQAFGLGSFFGKGIVHLLVISFLFQCITNILRPK